MKQMRGGLPVREVPLSHSCRQTGLCISGGRTPADRGKASGGREGWPVAGAKHPHADCSHTDCFCLGKFFCSHWRGQGRRELVSVLAGEGWRWAGPADRGGCPEVSSLIQKGMPVAGEGCLRGSGASLIFFVRHVKKKLSRVDVKTYFMTPDSLDRVGRGFCLSKRENQQ